jgi:hypothetical protein
MHEELLRVELGTQPFKVILKNFNGTEQRVIARKKCNPCQSIYSRLSIIQRNDGERVRK